MTPRQHPQEYIITDDQLRELVKNGVSVKSEKIAFAVLSRPAAAPAPCDICPYDETCEQEPSDTCLPYMIGLSRQQAAAKERERVLDALCKINTDDNVCKKGKNCKECMIDSLRQSPEQQEAGRE